jgi:hypothetical protein
MPRLRNKPVCLDEEAFIDWIQEVYYYRLLDQGLGPEKTPLKLSVQSETASKDFLLMIRAQMGRFELTFPLTKIAFLYAKALREISVAPLKNGVPQP